MKPQETADFRRKPQIFAENRRKPQIGLRHLRCVTFSSALVFFQRTPWGGGQKRWKTSRMTPLPKGFWTPPSYGTFSTALTCRCSVFPVQESTAEQARSSFGGGPNIVGRARSLVRFPPPIRFARPPPHADGVRVRFRVRFQAVKVQIFGGFPVESPTKKANCLKALLVRGISLSEYGSEGFRVRLRGSSECPSTVLLLA